MKEMMKIEKHVSKIHKEFMNVSRTPEDHLVADLQFSANFMKMAFWNLKRWAETTNKPKTAYRDMVKKIVREHK